MLAEILSQAIPLLVFAVNVNSKVVYNLHVMQVFWRGQ